MKIREGRIEREKREKLERILSSSKEIRVDSDKERIRGKISQLWYNEKTEERWELEKMKGRRQELRRKESQELREEKRSEAGTRKDERQEMREEEKTDVN